MCATDREVMSDQQSFWSRAHLYITAATYFAPGNNLIATDRAALSHATQVGSLLEDNVSKLDL